MSRILELADAYAEAADYWAKNCFQGADFEDVTQARATLAAAVQELERDAAKGVALIAGMEGQEPFAFCYVQKKSSVDILTFNDAPEDAVDGTLIPLYPQPKAEPAQELAADRLGDANKTPPFGSKRKAAMAVYTPPFIFKYGYIYDSQNLMVADNGGIGKDDPGVEGAVAARVRGWGRLGYLPNGAELQDEIGQMMADALNALYAAPQAKEDQIASPLEAKPVQEPVAWWIVSKSTDDKFVTIRPDDWNNVGWEKHPLYAAAPQSRVVDANKTPLTDEQIKEITSDNSLDTIHAVARAIEAAHGIKGIA